MGLKEKGLDELDRIKLPDDKDKWRAVVSMVMDLRVKQNGEDFVTSWESN